MSDRLLCASLSLVGFVVSLSASLFIGILITSSILIRHGGGRSSLINIKPEARGDRRRSITPNTILIHPTATASDTPRPKGGKHCFTVFASRFTCCLTTRRPPDIWIRYATHFCSPRLLPTASAFTKALGQGPGSFYGCFLTASDSATWFHC